MAVARHALEGVVNLAKYPLHNPEGLQTLCATARQKFLETGLVTFPQFLLDDAAEQAVSESRARVPDAFESVQRHNAFLLGDADPEFDKDHIRNRQLTTQVASVAYDELPPQGILRSLYESPEMVALVGGVVLGQAAIRKSGGLHRLADPLGACSINVFRPGRFHDWHFDESEFTTTLCLQPAKEGHGGHFLYSYVLCLLVAISSAALMSCASSEYFENKMNFYFETLTSADASCVSTCLRCPLQHLLLFLSK